MRRTPSVLHLEGAQVADLILHGREVGTVFDLLGRDENAVTASLGWALTRSGTFLRRFLKAALPGQPAGIPQAVHLQKHAQDGGYTDIEITTDKAHVIVEAKRRWNLPSLRQLNKYARRLGKGGGARAMVVLSECTSDYAAHAGLPESVRKIPVSFLPWPKVYELAVGSTGRTQVERRALADFCRYVEGIMDVQDQESNLVYVVSLSTKRRPWCRIKPIDWITKKRRYFHPYNWAGWPLSPPNYLGFRYHGRLQSIHHVEKAEIVEDLADHLDEVVKSRPGSWVLYRLGPPIVPCRKVKTGNLFRSARVWAALDLLLSSKTIFRARDLTKKRLRK